MSKGVIIIIKLIETALFSGDRPPSTKPTQRPIDVEQGPDLNVELWTQQIEQLLDVLILAVWDSGFLPNDNCLEGICQDNLNADN